MSKPPGKPPRGAGRPPPSPADAALGRLWFWLGLAVALVLADQFTKMLIVGSFRLGEQVSVTSFFNLVRVHNTGAAFSFLAGASGWQRWLFTGIAVAATVFIVWLLRAHSGQRLFAFALTCILGGAVGNLIDRIVHGHVIDFLLFHWGGWSFPAFNVADSAITVGAVGLILDELLRVRRGR